MSEIRYRLAKPSDAKEIANLHWSVRERYKEGIFLSMGKDFLASYYKLTLNDPWEVVVCAVNEEGRIVGFTETTLDAKCKYKNVRSHKLYMGWIVLKALLRRPYLTKAVWQRYRSLDENNSGPKFFNVEGVRGAFWCWSKSDDSLKSYEMVKVKNDILRAVGIKEYRFEVDKQNKAVYKFHLKVNKAEPIEEIKLPDGRVRVVMRKRL